MYYDVNAERPQVETIIKEIKDKDYTAGEKTSFYVDKKGKDIKKAIKYKQKYISKSLVQEPSEKTQTLAECESLALEDIFAGNNLKYAIVLKEILDPPKAIRPIGKN